MSEHSEHDDTDSGAGGAPDAGGLLGGLGGLGDLSGLLEQAQGFMAASAERAEQVVEGSAGGGAVKVTVNGRWEFQSVTIDPAVVDPADVSMLEDLVLAALRDAAASVEENQLDLPGGIDLGGLFGG